MVAAGEHGSGRAAGEVSGAVRGGATALAGAAPPAPAIAAVPWEPGHTRWLERFLQEAVRKARHRGEPLLASWVVAIPLQEPLESFARARLAGVRFFWSDPLEDGARLTLVGAGAAGYLAGQGAGRFRALKDGWRFLRGRIVQEGPAPRGAGPILVGGLAFDPPDRGAPGGEPNPSPWHPGAPAAPAADPRTEAGGDPWQAFGDARLILPELLITSQPGSCWLTVNAWIGPQEDPRKRAAALARKAAALLAWQAGPGTDPADGAACAAEPAMAAAPAAVEGIDPGPWMEAVPAAAGAVRRGQVRKVVLARPVHVRRAGGFDGTRVLASLAAANPRATLFALEVEGTAFLGATPERLARVEDGWVTSMALAGSAPRGREVREDRRLGQELLKSPKNREEHQVVVDALREGLAALTDGLEVAPEPGLLQLPTVQHLHTPVRGRLMPGATLLDVVERLHPTPAVGGWPRREALQLLRQLEGWDRGWYAGPFGWVDPAGDGAFAVALRSGLLEGEAAHLFAGCGIMGASDPGAEYREWQLKLRPLLGALQEAGA